MAILSTGIRRVSPCLRKPHHVRHSSSTTSSVNPTEVSHFNALASTWWDPHGSSRLLHLMNPHRHDFITSCLSSQPTLAPASKLRYLDVGCGGGIFAESAARLPNTASVTGIDPSGEVLRIAKAHARQDPLLQQSERLMYLEKSIEALPLPKNVQEQYDVLSLFEVIEHITHPATFLASCLPFVKPGGWLVLSTIARTWTSWLTTKVVAEDIVRLVPRGTHEWGKYINEEELRTLFQAQPGWGSQGGVRAMGVVYVPGFGWKIINGSEQWGNYFFGVRRDA
ncbi:MAG: putative COQ3-enzyme of ubiquinone (coenzyme Q) biosynthesis [Lasallia pustulata]|uniref:Ubiquinone biosynthesis O-methyltransferase, mitochondrial n=1 Tax=Lasallia pustulata TaxID=136370 RepID=A0A5M8PZA4_9LECA|nr:MAG: putative COQ3-enzyme of ubiquinone (coenzyme Q) biosynthesis [Lasallia pustulata]